MKPLFRNIFNTPGSSSPWDDLSLLQYVQYSKDDRAIELVIEQDFTIKVSQVYNTDDGGSYAQTTYILHGSYVLDEIKRRLFG